MRTILLLTGDDACAIVALRALGRRGLRVNVAGVGAGRLLRWSRYCGAYASVASSPELMAAGGEEVLDGIERLARDHGADVVFPADIPGTLCASRLRERLPNAGFFPFAQPETVRRLDDKWSFYQFLTELGVFTPRTRLVENPEQAREWALPLVLKPRRLSGGEGVRVVRTAADRDSHLAGLRLPALAQDYVDGEDVDLSFLADRGRLNAWCVQTTRKDGSIEYIEDERVVEIGRRIASASNYTGLAHIDMRYDGPARRRVAVIECNPRCWGSLPCTLSFEVDFLGRGLEMASGRIPSEARSSPAGLVPRLRASLRRLLSGRFDLSAPARAYLEYALGDPMPQLVMAVRERTSLKNFGR